MKRTIWIAGAMLMLSACGGGGSDSTTAPTGDTSSAPPVPMPSSPQPAPTTAPPATTGDPTLLTAVGRELPGLAGSSTIDLDATGVKSIGFIYSAGDNPAVRARVTGPGAFSYRLVAGFYGDVVGTIPLARQPSANGVWQDLTGTVGTNSYRITQLIVGPTNVQLPLIYATTAIARAWVERSGGERTYNIAPLAFGLLYAGDRGPLPSVIRYEGRIAGIASAPQLEGNASPLSTRNTYDVTGTVRIEAVTATGAITGELRLVGRNEATGDTLELGTLPLSANGQSAAVTTLLRASLEQGGLSALLAGPNAEEVLGTFNVQVADPAVPAGQLSVIGVLAGRR